MSACHPPMDPNLSKILQDSGWGNGFKIPFANEENKALEKEVSFTCNCNLFRLPKLVCNVFQISLHSWT